MGCGREGMTKQCEENRPFLFAWGTWHDAYTTLRGDGDDAEMHQSDFTTTRSRMGAKLGFAPRELNVVSVVRRLNIVLSFNCRLLPSRRTFNTYVVTILT